MMQAPYPEPLHGDFTPSRDASDLQWLQSSTDIHAAAARANIAIWAAEWAHGDDAEMMRRLQSANAAHGAIWELFVNHELRRHGLNFSRLTAKQGKATPDFLVHRAGLTYHLEATTLNKSNDDNARDRQFNQILDYLDKHSDSRFHIRITLCIRGSGTASAKRLYQQIRSWLAGLPDDASPFSAQEIRQDGWVFEVSPFRHSGSSNRLVIASNSRGLQFRNDSGRVRDALQSKVAKYRHSGIPLVIFLQEPDWIGAASSFHRAAAMLGDDGICLSIESGDATEFRAPNGLWISGQDWQYADLLAVAIGGPLLLHAPKPCELEIWQHPLHKEPLDLGLTYPTWRADGDGAMTRYAS